MLAGAFCLRRWLVRLFLLIPLPDSVQLLSARPAAGAPQPSALLLPEGHKANAALVFKKLDGL
jgi:hypothetical protein